MTQFIGPPLPELRESVGVRGKGASSSARPKLFKLAPERGCFQIRSPELRFSGETREFSNSARRNVSAEFLELQHPRNHDGAGTFSIFWLPFSNRCVHSGESDSVLCEYTSAEQPLAANLETPSERLCSSKTNQSLRDIIRN